MNALFCSGLGWLIINLLGMIISIVKNEPIITDYNHFEFEPMLWRAGIYPLSTLHRHANENPIGD